MFMCFLIAEFTSFLCDNDNIQWLNFCTMMIQTVLCVFLIEKACILYLLAVDCFMRWWVKSAFTTRPSKEFIDVLSLSRCLYWIVVYVVVMVVPSVCMDDTRLNAFIMRLDIVRLLPFNAQNECCCEWCYRLLTLYTAIAISVNCCFIFAWEIHSANNYLSLIWWFWMNICATFRSIV